MENTREFKIGDTVYLIDCGDCYPCLIRRFKFDYIKHALNYCNETLNSNYGKKNAFHNIKTKWHIIGLIGETRYIIASPQHFILIAGVEAISKEMPQNFDKRQPFTFGMYKDLSDY